MYKETAQREWVTQWLLEELTSQHHPAHLAPPPPPFGSPTISSSVLTGEAAHEKPIMLVAPISMSASMPGKLQAVWEQEATQGAGYTSGEHLGLPQLTPKLTLCRAPIPEHQPA
jgi:hypothetical protein